MRSLMKNIRKGMVSFLRLFTCCINVHPGTAELKKQKSEGSSVSRTFEDENLAEKIPLGKPECDGIDRTPDEIGTSRKHRQKDRKKVSECHNLKTVERRIKHLKKLEGHGNVKSYSACFERAILALYRFRIRMQLIGGCSLREYCRIYGLFQDDIRPILIRIGAALKHMHTRKIIHLQINPDSIMINRKKKLKIVNFSDAQIGPSGHGFHGTEGYIAPEIYKLAKGTSSIPFGYAVDYYSLGCTLHWILFREPPPIDGILLFEEMIAGTGGILGVPFEVPLPFPVDPGLKDLLNGLLHPNPEKRFNDHNFLQWMYYN